MGIFNRHRRAPEHDERPSHIEQPDVDDSDKTNQYYALFDRIELARRASDFDRVLALSMQGVELVPSLVRETIRLYGRFDLRSIPPVEYVCRFAPIRQDTALLRKTRSVVEPLPQLEYWVGAIDEAIERVDVVGRLIELIESTPGILQKDLGRLLGVHGRITAGLVRDLVLDGQLISERLGKSWSLSLPKP